MTALIEPFDFLTAVADRLKDVPEFQDNVYFPNPDRIEASPTIMILGGALPLGPSRIEWTLSRPVWLLNYTVRIAVDTAHATETEQALLWRLLPKVIDVLDPTPFDGGVNTMFPTLEGQVNHNSPRSFADGTLVYASAQKLYVIEVYYEAKFHRTPNVIPLGG